MANNFWHLFFVLILLPLSGFSDVVDEPSHCLEKNTYPCALRFVTKSRIQAGAFDIFGKKNSSLLLVNNHEIQILEGGFWVAAKSTVHSRNPLYTLNFEGEVWLERKNDLSLLVRNLNGKVLVTGSKLVSQYQIPVGFENWYLGLNSLGQVQQGMLKPIEQKVFLKDLLPVLALDRSKALQASHAYKELWKGSVEDSSTLYQEIVSRQIASVEDKRNHEEAIKTRKENFKAKMRNMFKERFYLNSQAQDLP